MSNSNKKFKFSGLFIFDLANNHQGSVEHAKRIIDEVAKVVKSAQVRAAIKLQFRELDSFIHPDFKNSTENKHIPRFLSTRLSEKQFADLVAEIRKEELITMCTPFDEASVDAIERLGIEVIKIASASATDWPLLEKISQVNKPVICSTGGLTIKEIDKIVSFFQHRGVYFALEHCVSIYPTPNDKLNLNRIEILKNRYPDITIGFSTHEEPTNLNAIKVAFAKGARIFERHVGIATNEFKLNTYSSTPEQIAKWLESYKEAVGAAGPKELLPSDPKELSDLESLMRGVYARKNIKAGQVLQRNDIFFAMPFQPGQLKSGRWMEGLVADREYKINQTISQDIRPDTLSEKDIIYSTIHAVKGMLNEAKIAVGYEFSVELSHHYGVEKFPQIGATIIDCVNREYCKKLIVQLAGQKHPMHYHQKKEETFQILHGILDVDIEGRKRRLYPGDTLLVPRGVWHSFQSPTGVIIEEISTTHFNDDSFYEDKAINQMPREQRKTKLINWGRHQFDNIA